MRSVYRLVELSIPGRDGSSISAGLSFGWLRATQGAKFKIPLPRSCVRRPVECTCQVSSTSVQPYRVLKMSTPRGRTAI